MNAARLNAKRQLPSTFLVVVTALLVSSICSPDKHITGQSDDQVSPAKIKLIYDGDVGPDPCDFSTLSMLHEYHKKGMIDLVGVIGETPDPFVASTFSVYNQFYGNDIPIGAFNSDPEGVRINDDIKKNYHETMSHWCYTNPNESIYKRFGNSKTKTADDVPHSVAMYRQLLSQAADNSITIYAAGPLFTFPALFESPGDQHSPLTGMELLKKKVKEFVFMGGWFPNSSDSPWYGSTGAEYNWWAMGSKNTTKTTLEAIVAMEKPVTYVGAAQGPRILVGKEMAARLGRENPTTESYYQFKRTAEIPEDSEDGSPVLKFDNPAFDDIALFYAVEGGVGQYFDRVRGRIQVDEKGANTWVVGDGNESYITIKIGTEPRLREVITDRITGKILCELTVAFGESPSETLRRTT